MELHLPLPRRTRSAVSARACWKVCPSIAVEETDPRRPAPRHWRQGEDPARLIFNAKPAAIVASLVIDLGVVMSPAGQLH